MNHLSFIIITGVAIGLVAAYIFNTLFIVNPNKAIARRRKYQEIDEKLERLEKEIKKKLKKN